MNWIYLKQINKTDIKTFENKNIVSLSLFQMDKKEGYKPNSFKIEYFDKMLEVIKGIKTYSKTYHNFIIYLDYFLLKKEPDLIKSFINKYSDDSNFVIYLYLIPKFIKPDKTNHIGTVGTMTRFIPLFDNIKYNSMWITDVDLSQVLIRERLQFIESSIFNTNILLLDNFIDYKTHERLPKNRKFFFVAGAMVFRVKFPKELLNNFMNNIPKRVYNNILNKTTLVKPGTEKFPYGTDEWFLNVILYNYIIEHKLTITYIRVNIFFKVFGLRHCHSEFVPIFNKNFELFSKLEKELKLLEDPDHKDFNKYKSYFIQIIDILRPYFNKYYDELSDICKVRLGVVDELYDLYKNKDVGKYTILYHKG